MVFSLAAISLVLLLFSLIEIIARMEETIPPAWENNCGSDCIEHEISLSLNALLNPVPNCILSALCAGN